MPRWSSGRVVLIGDACWCQSPLAGQGASMALAGGYVLAEALDRWHAVDSALARYEQQLKPAIERQQNAAARIAKWFVPDDALHLVLGNAVARASIWPIIAPVLRRRLSTENIIPRAADAAN
jgi:2-polyprenyl-6-methoxyphenol hydroxylase-like FAD-dependent oxidoreductase